MGLVGARTPLIEFTPAAAAASNAKLSMSSWSHGVVGVADVDAERAESCRKVILQPVADISLPHRDIRADKPTTMLTKQRNRMRVADGVCARLQESELVDIVMGVA